MEKKLGEIVGSYPGKKLEGAGNCQAGKIEGRGESPTNILAYLRSPR